MDIVTIACPPDYTDPNVAENAPIWLDANGVEYQVASGLLEGYTTTEPIQATQDRVNVVVGMDGLDALAAMGLTVKEDVIEDMLNHLHTVIP
jgi:hypothetical protein